MPNVLITYPILLDMDVKQEKSEYDENQDAQFLYFASP